jgi:hypothetical protein
MGGSLQSDYLGQGTRYRVDSRQSTLARDSYKFQASGANVARDESLARGSKPHNIAPRGLATSVLILIKCLGVSADNRFVVSLMVASQKCDHGLERETP